jgi:phosphonate transport system substrate-binding protein
MFSAQIVTADAFLEIPRNALTEKPYRGSNILSLWIDADEKKFRHQVFATYKQWQELGAQVRGGEKGSLIVKVGTWTPKQATEGTKPTVDNHSADDDETAQRMFAKPAWVFNIDQVDTPHEVRARILPAEVQRRDLTERLAAVDAFVAAVGIEVREGQPREVGPVHVVSRACSIGYCCCATRPLESVMPYAQPVRRRTLLAGAASAAALTGLGVPHGPALAGPPLKFGLTPVFLTNDLELLTKLRAYLARSTGCDIELVQRRTYQEITSLLVSQQLDAAWICGYPFIAFREQLALVSVPVWQGKPLYSSYLIAAAERDVDSIAALEGDVHAFSDPDSNSGYLVTRAALAQIRRRPEEFFRRTFFTWGHRNVVRAVGSGLAASGSVDGYVYDVLAEAEPSLVRKTRVVRRSELMGFPPIACSREKIARAETHSLRRALLSMPDDEVGREILQLLQLDGFVVGTEGLFDSVAEKLRIVRAFG